VEVITVSAQWPVERIAHWEALLAGRAVESQAFVVACNRTGKAQVGRRKMELTFPGRSQILTPDGAVVVKGDETTRLIVSEFDPAGAVKMHSRIPVHKDERRTTYDRWPVALE
jgi:predicted amidohydrolase